jgi:hypothetical protein
VIVWRLLRIEVEQGLGERLLGKEGPLEEAEAEEKEEEEEKVEK